MTELHIEYLPNDKQFAVPDGQVGDRAEGIIGRAVNGSYHDHFNAAGLSNLAVFNRIRALCLQGEFDPTKVFLHYGAQCVTMDENGAFVGGLDLPPSPDATSAGMILRAQRRTAR